MRLLSSFRVWIHACAYVILALNICSCSIEEENAMIYDESAILDRRKEIDDFFASDASSPLKEEQKSMFKGLQYFPPSEDFTFFATFTKSLNPDTVMLLTSKGAEKRAMLHYGTLSFSLQDGHNHTLSTFKSLSSNDGILFIPFKDKTNGFETYEAGRYLELDEEPNQEEYFLDFNRAYNPYCAYNKEYSCPLVPKENVLTFSIKAGEKRPILQ